MANVPPSELTPPQQALWWLKQGDFKPGPAWEKAHAICQTSEGTFEYDVVHALAHWIEGDIANRNYWYARVGAEGRADSIPLEWERVAAILE